MTTIVADLRLGLMGADTHTDYGHKVSKIWRCKKGVFGCAGDDTAIARFEDWILRKGKKPDQIRPRYDGDEIEGFQALQMHDGKLWIWDQAMRGELSIRSYAAIGSGAQWAMAAMDAGANLHKALEIAADRDSGTKPPFTFMEL